MNYMIVKAANMHWQETHKSLKDCEKCLEITKRSSQLEQQNIKQVQLLKKKIVLA